MLYKNDWEQAKKRLIAWWNNELLDRPPIQITAKRKNAIPASKWTGWETAHHLDNPEYVVEEFEKYCKETYFAGESFPNLWVNIGPGIMAAYIGAIPDIKEDTVWFETPKEWNDIEKIEFDPENEWLKKTCKMTSVFVKKGVNNFITGITDLGGNLDIAASFRGSQRLVYDLTDFPDKVKLFCKKINELWFKYYECLYNIIKDNMEGTSAWMGIWCHKRWYPIQCDFSAMISPKMFEEFVLPYLKQQCKFLDYSIYHWDGPGQIPHLDMLLEIKELTGIQWVPGVGAEPTFSKKWFPYYKKILNRGKTLVLIEVKPEQVKPIIEELGPKGILIQTYCSTEKQAEELLQSL